MDAWIALPPSEKLGSMLLSIPSLLYSFSIIILHSPPLQIKVYPTASTGSKSGCSAATSWSALKMVAIKLKFSTDMTSLTGVRS